MDPGQISTTSSDAVDDVSIDLDVVNIRRSGELCDFDAVADGVVDENEFDGCVMDFDSKSKSDNDDDDDDEEEEEEEEDFDGCNVIIDDEEEEKEDSCAEDFVVGDEKACPSFVDEGIWYSIMAGVV